MKHQKIINLINKIFISKGLSKQHAKISTNALINAELVVLMVMVYLD